MDARAVEHRAAHHRSTALRGVRRFHLPPVEARVPVLPPQAALRPQPVRARLHARAALRIPRRRGEESARHGEGARARALQRAGSEAASGHHQEEEGSYILCYVLLLGTHLLLKRAIAHKDEYSLAGLVNVREHYYCQLLSITSYLKTFYSAASYSLSTLMLCFHKRILRRRRRENLMLYYVPCP